MNEDINNPKEPLPLNKILLKYGFLMAIFILIILTMSMLFISLKTKNSEIINLEEKLTLAENTMSQLNTPIIGNTNLTDSTPSTKHTCSQPTENTIYTSDKKYFLDFSEGYHRICDYDDPDNPVMVEPVESRMQNGPLLFITIYGYQMFITNFEDKTLKYIDIDNFPDKNDYLNDDGSPYLWLFGPKEYDYKNLSPNRDKLIFGASDCHDCMTLIKNYVLDLSKGTITRLGTSNNSARWVDNNTVSWTEVSYREKTQQELEENPDDDFPAVLEVGETITKKF